MRHRLAEGLLTSKPAALVGAVLLVCVLGYVDILTGYDIRLGVFYLVPVALATWRAGLAAGLWLSLVSAIGMLIADSVNTSDSANPAHELVPYWNTAIRIGYFAVVAGILAALNGSLERERRRAREDALTGVPNRRAFIDLARNEIERSGRHHHPLSLAYVDCDNFKDVNDRFGHGTGDQVLKLVAMTLSERLRKSDVIARIGGDEFVILLPQTSPSAAVEVIQSLQAALAERMRAHGWSVTVSVGACTFLTPPETLEYALKVSDDLLYVAKRRGKNAVNHRIFDASSSMRDAHA